MAIIVNHYKKYLSEKSTIVYELTRDKALHIEDKSLKELIKNLPPTILTIEIEYRGDEGLFLRLNKRTYKVDINEPEKLDDYVWKELRKAVESSILQKLEGKIPFSKFKEVVSEADRNISKLTEALYKILEEDGVVGRLRDRELAKLLKKIFEERQPYVIEVQ